MSINVARTTKICEMDFKMHIFSIYLHKTHFIPYFIPFSLWFFLDVLLNAVSCARISYYGIITENMVLGVGKKSVPLAF